MRQLQSIVRDILNVIHSQLVSSLSPALPSAAVQGLTRGKSYTFITERCVI